MFPDAASPNDEGPRRSSTNELIKAPSSGVPESQSRMSAPTPPGSRTATQMAFCSCSSQSNARIQRGSHLVNVVAHLAQMPKRFLASTLCSHIKHVAALSLPIMPTTLWPFLLKIEPSQTLELIGCFFPTVKLDLKKHCKQFVYVVYLFSAPPLIYSQSFLNFLQPTCEAISLPNADFESSVGLFSQTGSCCAIPHNASGRPCSISADG